ncbi:MAG TPA: hypothetical protein VGJ73_09210 [Verrucomicrobiae bacterium]
MKKKHLNRSSLRDINQRYGRKIRAPARSKKSYRSRGASPSKTLPHPEAAPTRRNRIILWSIIIGAAVILAVCSHVFHLSTIHAWGVAMNSWLLVSLILVLPLFGMPMSLCAILIGAKFGATYGLAVTAVAVAFHLSASWVLARTWLHKPVKKLLKKTRCEMPPLETGEYAGVCLLTALIPGPSYTLKNYFLALSNLPFRIILGVGLPANLFAMSPGVLFGSLSGAMNWPKAIFLIAYVLLLFVAAHWVVRAIRNHSNHAKPAVA